MKILTDMDGTLTHTENLRLVINNNTPIECLVDPDKVEFVKLLIQILFGELGAIIVTKNNKSNIEYFLEWAGTKILDYTDCYFGTSFLSLKSEESDKVKIDKYSDLINKSSETVYILDESVLVLISLVLKFPTKVIPVFCNKNKWFPGQIYDFCLNKHSEEEIKKKDIITFLENYQEKWQPTVYIWQRLHDILETNNLEPKFDKNFIVAYKNGKKVFKFSIETYDIFKPNGKVSIINLAKEATNNEFDLLLRYL